MPHDLAQAGTSDFQEKLLDWYREAARPLPWRTAPSLYRTVVSEFMCQQTQVATVLPYFERWMQALPDFAALAAAPEAEVLKLWEGLGYYSRARNLHRLAQQLVALETMPTSAEAWQLLPGVGPYIASAVTSIAFGQAEAVVDGNVVRILTRLDADATEYPDAGRAVQAVRPRARELLNAAAPGDHNQAMMELGATICLKARPACLLCPVRSHCAGYASGEPAAFPRIRRRATEHLVRHRLWALESGRLLLHRIPDHSKRLAGAHELPEAPERLLGPELHRFQRGISNQRITEIVHRPRDGYADWAHKEADLVWQPVEALDQLRLSGPHKREITRLLSAAS